MPRNHNDGVLTSDQVQKFFLEGFLHLPGILGEIALATVRSAMDEIIRTATPGKNTKFRLSTQPIRSLFEFWKNLQMLQIDRC